MAALKFASLEEAKNYCRIQHCALDDTIDLLIMAASNAVKNYLKDFSPYQGERNADGDYVLDSNYEPEIELDNEGNRVVKAEVKLAVLYEVDRRLKFPNTETDQQMGYLSNVATGLLYPLRDPALK
jgi:hypothetical protein